MELKPYLTFNGNCEEALNFYRDTLGGTAEITRFSEIPEDSGMPIGDDWADKIMHASLTFGDNLVIFFSDIFQGGAVTAGDAVSVHLDVDTEDEVKKIFDSLSVGGKVTMPVDKMFWGAVYGSFVDKFGVTWGIHYQLPQ